jgi:hypothetical protein
LFPGFSVRSFLEDLWHNVRHVRVHDQRLPFHLQVAEAGVRVDTTPDASFRAGLPAFHELASLPSTDAEEQVHDEFPTGGARVHAEVDDREPPIVLMNFFDELDRVP